MELSTPGIVDAWRLFLKLEKEQVIKSPVKSKNKKVKSSMSGEEEQPFILNWEGVAQLAFQSCGATLKPAGIQKEIEEANPDSMISDEEIKGKHSLNGPMGDMGCTFHQFSRWVSRYRAIERREVRRLVKENFELYDKDNSGMLDKHEFEQVVLKTNKYMNMAINIEEDWAAISKVPIGEEDPGTGEFEEGVTFNDFERWWKERAGIVEPDIPVLPEFMVQRIAEQSRGYGCVAI